MNGHGLIRFNNLLYRKPVKIVQCFLKDINIIPETDIIIYPDYPYNWHATVGANNRLYIIKSLEGHLFIENIESISGFNKSGTFIRRDNGVSIQF